MKPITNESITNGTKMLKKDLEKYDLTEKNTFTCEICGFSCFQVGQLNTYMASFHEGKKPFKCEMCDYRGSRENNWKEHVETAHKEMKTFKCKICERCFSYKRNLDDHIISLHEL